MPNGVKALAALPSLDELRAKIVGLIQAPATKIAQLVNAPAAQARPRVPGLCRQERSGVTPLASLNWFEPIGRETKWLICRKSSTISPSLTVLEAAELAKLLEEKWGVSAAAAVAVAGPAAGAAAAPAEEKTEFTVILAAAGDKKIEVIKEVRAHHRSRPQGGQGPGRSRSQGGQGRRDQGRGREDQGPARKGRRQGRAEVSCRLLSDGPGERLTRGRPEKTVDRGFGLPANRTQTGDFRVRHPGIATISRLSVGEKRRRFGSKQAESHEKQHWVPTPVLMVAMDCGLPESRPGPGGTTERERHDGADVYRSQARSQIFRENPGSRRDAEPHRGSKGIL